MPVSQSIWAVNDPMKRANSLTISMRCLLQLRGNCFDTRMAEESTAASTQTLGGPSGFPESALDPTPLRAERARTGAGGAAKGGPAPIQEVRAERRRLVLVQFNLLRDA
ncbi:unnamed protein product [Prorocentrum cordatum]|uniref:Uncharacterized protein n=1 Tax=Prorocentrum cordatum TaxID=2364126 RepID=A0ABN9QJN0_9DINO|nr:unnamed protein product [Polarella glacialis]